ncbi:MAG: hypothetical protein RL499_876 [Actinomycetota bacterium]
MTALNRTTRSSHWSQPIVAQLRDATRCPVCGRSLQSGMCPACGADLRGAPGAAVWSAASAAAAALTSLERAVASIPQRPLEPRVPVTSPTAPAAPAPLSPAAPAPRASTTVQSVLAVAGAGLMATAALVFTFFNRDLTDPLARAVVVGIAALVFMGGAPALMRRALRVSAECFGLLGGVFVALTVTALNEAAVATVDPWAAATIDALVAGTVAHSLGVRTGIRSWMLTGTLALPLVPLFASAALTGSPFPLWGPLGSAAIALALLEASTMFTQRRGVDVRAERALLVAVLLAALALLAARVLDLPDAGSLAWIGATAAVLGAGAIAARATRHALRVLLSAIAGASVPLALVLATGTLTTEAWGGPALALVIVPLAAGFGLLVLVAVTRAGRPTRRRTVVAGAMSIVVASVMPSAMLAAFGAVLSLVPIDERSRDSVINEVNGLAAVLGLFVVALVFAAHAWLIGWRAGRPTPARSAASAAALWALGLAALGALGLVQVTGATRATVAIVLVGAASLIVSMTPAGRRASAALRAPIVLAAHAALLIAVSLSWSSWVSPLLAVLLGPLALVALAALATTVPRVLRPAHLAVGSSYGLILIAVALGLIPLDTAGHVSVTATAGLIVAIVATLSGRLRTDYWATVLTVTSVPFLLAVALVIGERSAWVILSTSAMITLATILVLTRRRELAPAVRALAAAVVVPSIAVVLVNLGAVALETSGSPVVLPTIAVVVAAALTVARRVETLLVGRGLDAASARAVTVAGETTTWVTAALTVTLSFVRDAAGVPTAALVLALLAVGAGLAATTRRAAAYWWVGALLATAAIWCLWFVIGVTSLEAHVLPPALTAALVALSLTAAGRPQPRLFAAGALAAILPVAGLLALGSEGSTERLVALLSTAAALVVAGRLLSSPTTPLASRLAPLRAVSLGVAIVASMAGTIQGTRFGLGLDTVDAPSAVTLAPVALALTLALAGAVPAALAGLLLARDATPDQRRWALVPAITAIVVAGCSAIDADQLPIAWISAMGFTLLVAMVVAVWREQSVATVLPRVWVLFALALGTAIVAWSPRDLRVEWFSVPLGVMLLVAGTVVLVRGSSAASAPLHHWPMGRSGSWALLGPGIVVTVFASMLATATDPQTWRAVLVMSFALVAILVGVRWRLAAPFVLGMIILPIENVLAFSVQIGRGIEAMPWWITLAVVGVVLLVIAVGSERRSGDEGAPTARLRDLR